LIQSIDPIGVSHELEFHSPGGHGGHCLATNSVTILIFFILDVILGDVIIYDKFSDRYCCDSSEWICHLDIIEIYSGINIHLYCSRLYAIFSSDCTSDNSRFLDNFRIFCFIISLSESEKKSRSSDIGSNSIWFYYSIQYECIASNMFDFILCAGHRYFFREFLEFLEFSGYFILQYLISRLFSLVWVRHIANTSFFYLVLQSPVCTGVALFSLSFLWGCIQCSYNDNYWIVWYLERSSLTRFWLLFILASMISARSSFLSDATDECRIASYPNGIFSSLYGRWKS